MAVQTWTLAGKRYVILPEREYLELKRRSGEDRRDGVILRRRLRGMRRRGEKPMAYVEARRELGFK